MEEALSDHLKLGDFILIYISLYYLIYQEKIILLCAD